MNIKYKGDSKDVNHRSAIITHNKSEKNMIDRFLILLDDEMRNYHADSGVVTVHVEDRNDYNDLKDLYNAYKNFDYADYLKKHKLLRAVAKWHKGLYTEEGLYDACERDVDLYVILVSDNFDEDEIVDIMENVSCASDAYGNAILDYCELLQHYATAYRKCRKHNETAGKHPNRVTNSDAMQWR